MPVCLRRRDGELQRKRLPAGGRGGAVAGPAERPLGQASGVGQRDPRRGGPLAGGRTDEEWDGLVRRARSLVPREWRTTLDETAWAAKLETSSVPAARSRPFRTYCQSCSGSLREYPSPSESYCRFCADDDGRLLPREEVHRIIAHWMTLWQDGISEEDARARATLYMSAMPAWS